MDLTIKTKEETEAEEAGMEAMKRATDALDDAVQMALVATKAALRSLKGNPNVKATTPSFRFKKDGTILIKVNLEVKPV